MSGVMETGMEGGQGSRSGAPDGRPEGGREVRWSARRKEAVVLRLLRGEALDALAREHRVAAAMAGSSDSASSSDPPCKKGKHAKKCPTTVMANTVTLAVER